MATLIVGNVGVNTDLLEMADILLGTVAFATGSQIRVNYGSSISDLFTGSFQYNSQGDLVGGTLTGLEETQGSSLLYRVTGVSIPVATFLSWVLTNDNIAARLAVFAGADTVTGSPSDDLLRSYAGADTISAGNGNDQLDGGSGNDSLDGGVGLDIAMYSGNARNYAWTLGSNGAWTVIDYRLASPEGVDSLRNIELLQFADQTISLAATPAQALQSAFDHILRFVPTSDASLNNLTARVAAGTMTQAAAVAALVQLADSSTSVATLAYQFFTGRIPSGEGLDYLVSPTGGNPNNLASAYYQSFNLENRFINFAVNLGKLGEGKAQFEAAYGSKTLIDAAKTAYATIYGSTPTDAKVHLLIDSRADYFAYYGQDGVNGIGTKAAMVGWLLAEAVKADIGTMQTANMAFLTDLADGAAYSANLVGVYGGTPYLG